MLFFNMMSASSIVLVAVIWNQPFCQASLDEGVITNKTFTCRGVHCFVVMDEELIWEEADSYCRGIDHQLIKIDSEESFDTLEGLVSHGISSSSYWIGARLQSTGRRRRRNQGVDPKCGIVRHVPDRPIEYREANCFELRYFVCTTYKAANGSCNEGYKPNCLPNMCVKAVGEAANWFLADQTCRQTGGQLINSDQEVNARDAISVIEKCFPRRGRGKRSPDERSGGSQPFELWNRYPGISWVWTDDTPVTFTMWSEDSPTTQLNPCVSVVLNSESDEINYSDESCDKAKKFICEADMPDEDSHEHNSGGPDKLYTTTPSGLLEPRSTMSPWKTSKTTRIGVTFIIGTSAGVVTLVIIIVIVIIICLRRHHKREIKKVILRANTLNSDVPLYREASGLSESNFHDVNNVTYNRVADIAVISNIDSYQGLVSSDNFNFYEPLDGSTGIYSSTSGGEGDGDSGRGPSPAGTPTTPLPPPPRARSRQQSPEPSISTYEYIRADEVQQSIASVVRPSVAERVALPSAPSTETEASYLQILPNTPKGTPLTSPVGTPKTSPRSESSRKRSGDGTRSSSFLHTRASSSPIDKIPNAATKEPDMDDEEGSEIVDNIMYEGRSSKKEVSSVASPKNEASTSQL